MDAPSLSLSDLLDVRHLKLRINLLSAEDWSEQALRRRAPWVVTGSLKSVCLTLVNPEDPDLTDWSLARTNFDKYLEWLRRAGGEGRGYLGDVKRTVAFDLHIEEGVVPALQVMDEVSWLLDVVSDAFGAEVHRQPVT